MLKVGETGDGDRLVDRSFQGTADKRSDACRDAPDWKERALSCYVFKTGRSAISRRQVVIPCCVAGDSSIGVLTSRQNQRCAAPFESGGRRSVGAQFSSSTTGTLRSVGRFFSCPLNIFFTCALEIVPLASNLGEHDLQPFG